MAVHLKKKQLKRGRKKAKKEMPGRKGRIFSTHILEASV